MDRKEADTTWWLNNKRGKVDNQLPGSISMMTQVSEGKESTKGQSTRPAQGGLCDASPTAKYLEAQLPHLKSGNVPFTCLCPRSGVSVSGREQKRFYSVVGCRVQVSYFIHKNLCDRWLGKKYLECICFRQISSGIWSPRFGYPLSNQFLSLFYVFLHIYIYRRRKWQSTPVFLPGKFHEQRSLAPVFLPGELHGQRSLVGYSSWSCKELDTTEWLTHTHTHIYRIFFLALLGLYCLVQAFSNEWGYSSLQCMGFSLWWLLLGSMSSKCTEFSICGTRA